MMKRRDPAPAKTAKEKDHQIVVIDWAKRQYLGTMPYCVGDFLFAIPNGTQLAGSTKTRAIYMNSLKRQGLKPGVSDLFLSLPMHGRHGAYIEMKSDRGRPTDSQLDFLSLMVEVGYYGDVCRGADEAINSLKNYIAGGDQPLLVK